MKIVITGATGFIGTAVVDALLDKKMTVVALVRHRSSVLPDEVDQFVVSDYKMLLSEHLDENIEHAMYGADTLIHLAARAHIMNESATDPLAEFREVNTDGTLALANKSIQMGIKRFIFISSIKVNGEETQLGDSFKADDDFVPSDPYGLSKYEAEQGLLKLADETKIEAVIIRPPLVYGSGVRANFLSMMKWVNKGIPLPFGSIYNKRSLVALDNLTSFIIHCVKHPKAANEVFLISDGEDVSTTELLRKVAKAFDKKTLLLPVPVGLMKFVAKLLGKTDVANRLFGSLQVDSSKARDLLDWKPVITMDEQLKKIADEHLNEKTV